METNPPRIVLRTIDSSDYSALAELMNLVFPANNLVVSKFPLYLFWTASGDWWCWWPGQYHHNVIF